MSNLAIHFATGNDIRQTPPEVFDPLNETYGFVVDLAALASTRRVELYLGPDQPHEDYQDALTVPWAEWFGDGPGWCNPPYSRGMQGQFIAKASREAKKGFVTVMLLPARPDTTAFHHYIWDRKEQCPRPGVTVDFLEGRIQFLDENGKPFLDKKGKPTRAPFPSMVVVFRNVE